jgi:hypothetical protein
MSASPAVPLMLGLLVGIPALIMAVKLVVTCIVPPLITLLRAAGRLFGRFLRRSFHYARLLIGIVLLELIAELASQEIKISLGLPDTSLLPYARLAWNAIVKYLTALF